MTTESNTPETDAFYRAHPISEYENVAHPSDCDAWVDFARSLERRLAAQDRELEGLRSRRWPDDLEHGFKHAMELALLAGAPLHILDAMQVEWEKNHGPTESECFHCGRMQPHIADLRQQLEQAQAQIEPAAKSIQEWLALIAENESLKTDARRYRWMRLRFSTSELPYYRLEGEQEADIDVAIDAAMKEVHYGHDDGDEEP